VYDIGVANAITDTVYSTPPVSTLEDAGLGSAGTLLALSAGSVWVDPTDGDSVWVALPSFDTGGGLALAYSPNPNPRGGDSVIVGQLNLHLIHPFETIVIPFYDLEVPSNNTGGVSGDIYLTQVDTYS